jgi:cytochrome c biogenesis protein CcmG/thiol:disulfide interchange protein DsbE
MIGQARLFMVVLGLCLLGAGVLGDAAAPGSSTPHRGLLTPGQPAPHFAAQGLDGQTITLQEYQGRPVVLNFWATWCVPCRREMPALQAVYEGHQAAGLVVLAINQDQLGAAEAVRAYYAMLGLTLPPLLDPDGQVARRYNVFLLPSTVFVHPTLTITAVHFGPMTQAQIERYLTAIMP